MPMLVRGCYSRDRDYPYEVETTYCLKFYISASLFSMNRIFEIDNDAEIADFENVFQYYHFFTDNIFFYLGLINERLIYKNGMWASEGKGKYINLNRTNYFFDEEEFAIISNKKPRNIIEHLDDRNQSTTRKFRGVGGFNVIHKGCDSAMVASIKENRNLYPYCLDLVEKKVLFYNIQEDDVEQREFEVDLLMLQKELEMLKRNVEKFEEFLRG